MFQFWKVFLAVLGIVLISLILMNTCRPKYRPDSIKSKTKSQKQNDIISLDTNAYLSKVYLFNKMIYNKKKTVDSLLQITTNGFPDTFRYNRLHEKFLNTPKTTIKKIPCDQSFQVKLIELKNVSQYFRPFQSIFQLQIGDFILSTIDGKYKNKTNIPDDELIAAQMLAIDTAVHIFNNNREFVALALSSLWVQTQVHYQTIFNELIVYEIDRKKQRNKTFME